jgi:MFS family permease
MAWPIDSTFISEVLPPRARANVFGYRSALWNLGWSIASLAGGWIIVKSGYDWTFFSLIAFTAISVIIFVTYYERHPLIKAGQIPSALPPRRRLAAAAAAVEAVDLEQPATTEDAAPRTRVA